jgi:hypothetical protein
METSIKGRTLNGAKRELFLAWLHSACGTALCLLLLAAGILMLSACGGSVSSGSAPIQASVSGNWQFTMAPPADGSFLGGLDGGFLLENNGSVSGGATYSVSLPNLLVPCNSGSATVTGAISGESVNLTAVAGTQTFTLAGSLNLNGTTMTGTYKSTAGTASDGSPCGTAQTGLQWSAILVPPLTGPIQGTFHSASGAAGLNERVFLVSGGLTQAANSGASSAIVTGNLSFVNAITNASDYPCVSVGWLSGQISGNSVALQITASDGTEWGLIGEPLGSLGSTGVNPVTFDSVHGGYILHGAGPSYLVATTDCPGNLGNIDIAGDFGDICLALSGSACQQPITLTPSALIFPPQPVGSPPTTQTINLANASGASLGNVTLSVTNDNGAINFTETDNCGLNGIPSLGQPFNLNAGQSCAVSILFAPLETCAPGSQPDQCLTATLTVVSPSNGMIFTAQIAGGATSGGAVLTPQFDFGEVGVLETSLPQFVPFINLGRRPPQIAAGPSNGTLHDVGVHAEID